MPLLPRSRRGTWLLAAAAWLATSVALWWMMPVVPRTQWDIPTGRAEPWEGYYPPHVVSVRHDQRTVAFATFHPAPTVMGPFDWSRVFSLDSFDGPILVCDVDTGRLIRQHFTSEDSFQNLVASPDGRWIAALDRGDRERAWPIRLIDTGCDGEIELPNSTELSSSARPMAFTPDSENLIYPFRCLENFGLRCFDLETGQITREIADAEPPVAFAPDGRAIACVCKSEERHVIRVMDWPTLRPLADLLVENETVFDISLSAHGNRLAALLSDSTRNRDRVLNTFRECRCWDYGTRTELLRLPAEWTLPLTEDGETVVVYADAEAPSLECWDLIGGRVLWTRKYDSQTSQVTRTVSSADSRVVEVRNPLTGRDRLGIWAVEAGFRWPFAWRSTYTSSFIDPGCGKAVMSVPTSFGHGAIMSDQSSFVTIRTDTAYSTGARAEIWDIPPRKSLTSFTAGAALLALPIAFLARRRVRKLRAV